MYSCSGYNTVNIQQFMIKTSSSVGKVQDFVILCVHCKFNIVKGQRDINYVHKLAKYHIQFHSFMEKDFVTYDGKNKFYAVVIQQNQQL